MTSGINHKQTIEFYESNNFFGAKKDNIIFFEQSLLPAISGKEGKILMEEPHRLVMAPNGNGALFDAVNRNYEVKSILEEVDYVQVIGVDNVLNRLLDPLYIGFAVHHDL